MPAELERWFPAAADWTPEDTCPRSAPHESIGERHERYAARFGLDPTPGRAFIANLDFRGLTLEEGPVLRLERPPELSL